MEVWDKLPAFLQLCAGLGTVLLVWFGGQQALKLRRNPQFAQQDSVYQREHEMSDLIDAIKDMTKVVQELAISTENATKLREDLRVQLSENRRVMYERLQKSDERVHELELTLARMGHRTK